MNAYDLLDIAQSTSVTRITREGRWTVRTPDGTSLCCDSATNQWVRYTPWVGWAPVDTDEVLTLIRG